MPSIPKPLTSSRKRFVGAGTVCLLAIGAAGASMLVTHREPSPPARTTVSAQSAASEAPRPPKTPKTTPANTPSAAVAPKATEQKAPIVTLTGCLEREDETFQLKDTAGPDAPQARRWKTVFLKKGPAPVEVIDASNKLKLDDHVGRRVSMTGMLVDRVIQVRSLQRIASSCDKSPRPRA
ncbi:MAG: hypothetical protein WBD07_09425 [Vicinamibacterales bacterium]